MGYAKSIITKTTNRLKKRGFEYTRNHGYKHSIAFVKKNNKYIYISMNDDSNEMLIRTAENESDFSGGTNRFVKIESNFESIIKTIENMCENK